MLWWIHPTCPLPHPSCPYFQTIPMHTGDMGADHQGSLPFPHPRGQCQVCCVVLYHLLHCFIFDPPHFHFHSTSSFFLTFSNILPFFLGKSLPTCSTPTPYMSCPMPGLCILILCVFDEECSFVVTEFRQPIQVQSHREMPRILVQLGHTQRT